MRKLLCINCGRDNCPHDGKALSCCHTGQEDSSKGWLPKPVRRLKAGERSVFKALLGVVRSQLCQSDDCLTCKRTFAEVCAFKPVVQAADLVFPKKVFKDKTRKRAEAAAKIKTKRKRSKIRKK